MQMACSVFPRPMSSARRRRPCLDTAKLRHNTGGGGMNTSHAPPTPQRPPPYPNPAFKGHLLDPFPLEGHEAAGEGGVDGGEVGLGGGERSGVGPVKPGREGLDDGPGQRLHLHGCHLAEQTHWVRSAARSGEMANATQTNGRAKKRTRYSLSLL